MKKIILSFCCLVHLFSFGNLSPEETLKNGIDNLLRDVACNKEQLQANPEDLDAFIEEKLIPIFYVKGIVRLVLARHYKTLTDQEKIDFEDAFISYLIGQFSSYLFSADNDLLDIQYIKTTYNNKRTTKTAVVTTKFILTDETKPPIDVVFRMALKNEKWQIYTISAIGINLMLTYRNVYGPIIKQKGIQHLIKLLIDKQKEKNTTNL